MDQPIAPRLAGRTALVTGAATGMGRAIAARLAGEGARVAINHHATPEAARESAGHADAAAAGTGFGGGIDAVLDADVSEEAAVTALFAGLPAKWTRLDILVNNAGVLDVGASHDLSARTFDAVVGVNLRGAFLCAREGLRRFLADGRGGVIVTNSSVHEMMPKPRGLAYGVSKAGLRGLTATLALEYAGHGVRVNAVGPGAILTPMNQAALDNAAVRRRMAARIPMQRLGEAEEIAAVVAFLASDDASYITGQTLYACGGLTLYPELLDDWV